MMTTSMIKASNRRASTPSNNSGIGSGIVGMRLDVDRHADPSAVRRRSWPGFLAMLARIHGRWRVDGSAARGTVDLRDSASASRPMSGADMTITLADIEAARRTIAGQVLRTPMLPAPKLSALTGADGSRQIREPAGHQFVQGARRAQQAGVASAPRSARAASSPCRPAITRRRWPITPRRLGIPATIVMPVTTPFVKVEATAAHGAEVVLDGETVAEAQVRAEAIGARARPDFRASLRRSAGDRGAGHHRARNAGGRARPRHAGDPDRRRRADRRQRDRGARGKAGDRDHRGRGGALSLDVERARTRRPRRSAGRRWRKASRSRMSAR